MCDESGDSIYWLTGNCGNVEKGVQDPLRDWLAAGDSLSWEDVVYAECSTQCMLYSAVCCTSCMLDSIVCCTRCMLYSVYAVLGVYGTRC
jgi:hypothetical protein